MTHRTILKGLHTANPCSVGLVCPVCGQDNWLLAQPSFQRNCSKGKCVVYCKKCSNTGNPRTKPTSGSIHNDCFKPEALAKLSKLELNEVVENLHRRVWRYKDDLKLIREDATRAKRLRALKATEAVLTSITHRPLYKEVEQLKQPDQSLASYKADVAEKMAATDNPQLIAFYKKLLKDKEK